MVVYFNNEATKYVPQLLYASLAILIIPFAIISSYQVWKEAHPEIIKDQQKTPNSYIFAHVCSVDFLPLEVALHNMEQTKFVYLTVCFCNTLFSEVKLTSLSGSAQINNDKMERAILQEQKSVQIKRGFTILEKCQLNSTRELEMNFKGHIRIELDLVGYDDRNIEYKWPVTYGEVDDAQ